MYKYLDVFVIVYLDDILVYTNGTLEEHKEYIKKVLAKLRKYNLLINLEKSEFYIKETKYLGFIVSEKEVRIDPEKIEAVTN